jgi:exosome complex RNA-binding protein Csl4
MKNKQTGKNRLRLQEDEVAIIEEYRGLKKVSEEQGIDIDDVKHAWLKSDNASLFVKNPNFQLSKQNDFVKGLIKQLDNYSPKYKKISREKSKDGHLMVLDPADIHIGKLCSRLEVGTDYNSQIAVQRVLDGVHGVLKSSNGFSIDKINFIGGNDILHIDTPKRVTTSGTPQDTDGMWYENFLTAKKLYVDVLEILISIADVHFTFNPSNHDYMSGFMLSQTIESHFRNCKNITFDCGISHRKYFTYGNNLIGTTHGDGAKVTDLGALMAHESKDWTNCINRYFYTHHVHHKTNKDLIGITVESLRSPSISDSWHHRNGYTGSVEAVEAFIHHKKHGQIARLTHIFN